MDEIGGLLTSSTPNGNEPYNSSPPPFLESFMIPNDPPVRKQLIQRMLGYLLKRTDELTEWEQNFLESVNAQFLDKGNLSQKQCEILERLYDK